MYRMRPDWWDAFERKLEEGFWPSLQERGGRSLKGAFRAFSLAGLSLLLFLSPAQARGEQTLLRQEGVSPAPAQEPFVEEPVFVRGCKAGELQTRLSNRIDRVGTSFLEEPDFVRDCEASEVTKSASEPSRQVESGFLEETAFPAQSPSPGPTKEAQATFTPTASPTKKPTRVGLVKIGKKTYYFLKNGKKLINDSKVIDGVKYIFGSDGAMTEKYKYYKPGWVTKKNGKVYYRLDNGKIWKTTGLQTIGKYTYFFDTDGSRKSGFVTILGKTYYFKKNGKQYVNKGWLDIKGKTYYFLSGHNVATGLRKIKGKKYCFLMDGSLVKDKKYYAYDGQLYSIDQQGVCTETGLQGDGSHDPSQEDEGDSQGGGSSYGEAGECSQQARAFIAAHASSSASNYDQYRACFHYLLANQNFVVRSPSYYQSVFASSGWQYRFALDCFQSGLTGDCYGFACCMGAIGSELGYSPTVYACSQDHCFVEVDGLFIDNMGAQFFSSQDHSQYEVRHTASF